jgi:serine/threonine protein kinase
MAEALPLQPGDPRRLGEYAVTGRLGVGGHGAVFRGRDHTGRDVAIKLLHLRLTGEPAARARFRDAFSAARRVDGFCTAAILDADVEADRPFVVSEYVDGPSLAHLVDAEGPRGDAVVERLAAGIAVALAAIHRAGAVHHALTPFNILLGRDGPRVTDTSLVTALEAVGSAPADRAAEDPLYKAPEQLSGIDVGLSADVFAWACCLLFATYGRAPFGDGTPSEIMQRVLYDDPELGELPESLREIVGGALAKDPALRPTAAGLLERLLDEPGTLADRTPPPLLAEGRALIGSAPPPSFSGSGLAASVPMSAPVPEPSNDPLYDPPFAGSAAGPSRSSRPDSTTQPAPGPGGGPDWFARPVPFPPPEPIELTRVDTPAVDSGPPTSYDIVFDDLSTQNLRALPPADPAGGTEPTPHLIPGMERYTDDEGPGSTAVLPAVVAEPSPGGLGGMLGNLPRLRPGNSMLGVALSLTIGVLVGVLIIALVLWPQMRGEEQTTQQAGPAAINDRPVSAIPEGFAGTWKGTMVNPTRGASFPIQVTFTAGQRTARAQYPKSDCTGTLTLNEGTNRTLKMSLAINKPCSNGNVEISRQPDGTLQYSWTSSANQQLGYQGKLSRA